MLFNGFPKYVLFKHAKIEKIQELFPFTKYFGNAPQPIFKGRTFEEDFDIAEGCFRHIKKIFTQLEVPLLYHLLSESCMTMVVNCMSIVGHVTCLEIFEIVWFALIFRFIRPYY